MSFPDYVSNVKFFFICWLAVSTSSERYLCRSWAWSQVRWGGRCYFVYYILWVTILFKMHALQTQFCPLCSLGRNLPLCDKQSQRSPLLFLPVVWVSDLLFVQFKLMKLLLSFSRCTYCLYVLYSVIVLTVYSFIYSLLFFYTKEGK